MSTPAITVEALPAGYGDYLLISCPVGRRTWRGVRPKTWTGYAAIPELLRCSVGLRKPSEILIRTSLYQRM